MAFSYVEDRIGPRFRDSESFVLARGWLLCCNLILITITIVYDERQLLGIVLRNVRTM